MSDLRNYFNYFTEIEEHFQRVRGTSLFLLSPLDWALIESWKNAGVPLLAVLRGIDASFEKWQKRRIKTQAVNSLAFCAQAVLTEAQRTPGSEPPREAAPPFEAGEVDRYLQDNLARLRDMSAYAEIADTLAAFLEQPHDDLEVLEQRLAVLEQRMIALARTRESQTDALSTKRDLEARLQPYRRKMSAAQIDMLERQFVERKLLEQAHLPRLSLFYLH